MFLGEGFISFYFYFIFIHFFIFILFFNYLFIYLFIFAFGLYYTAVVFKERDDLRFTFNCILWLYNFMAL